MILPPTGQLAGQFSLNFSVAIHRIARATTIQSSEVCIHRRSLDRLSTKTHGRDWNPWLSESTPKRPGTTLCCPPMRPLSCVRSPLRSSTAVRSMTTGLFRAKNNRGLGVSVLFAGESGTGKSMAAEVIANALKAEDLYRIDLSAVVTSTSAKRKRTCEKLV